MNASRLRDGRVHLLQKTLVKPNTPGTLGLSDSVLQYGVLDEACHRFLHNWYLIMALTIWKKKSYISRSLGKRTNHFGCTPQQETSSSLNTLTAPGSLCCMCSKEWVPEKLKLIKTKICVNVAKVFFTNCHLFNRMPVTKMQSLKCYNKIRRQQAYCSERFPIK